MKPIEILLRPGTHRRYNVAPGTRVLLLSERDEQLQLDSGSLGLRTRVVG